MNCLVDLLENGCEAIEAAVSDAMEAFALTFGPGSGFARQEWPARDRRYHTSEVVCSLGIAGVQRAFSFVKRVGRRVDVYPG